MKINHAINFLIFEYLLVLHGYIFSFGFYSVSGVIILSISFILFLLFFVNPNLFKIFSLLNTSIFLFLTMMLSVVYLLLIFEPTLTRSGVFSRPLVFPQLFWVSFIFLFLALILVGSYFLNSGSLKKFLIIVLLALILKIMFVIISPAPRIDVYYFMHFGAKYFLSGLNPYSQYYPQVYLNVVPNYFAYLPASFIIAAPSVFFLSDPRYTFIIAELLIVIIFFLILNKKNRVGYNHNLSPQVIPIIFLFNPMSLQVLGQSYMESLILLGLALFMLLIISGRKILAFILLGILFALKQYTLVFLIPIFKLTNQSKYIIILSIVVATVIIFPFFLWSPSNFMHDAVYYQFNLPPRVDGLAINSFLITHFKINISGWLALLAIMFISLVIIKQPEYNIARFSQALTLLIFAFFLFNKWAFVNYYYLVSSLILLCIVTFVQSTKNFK